MEEEISDSSEEEDDETEDETDDEADLTSGIATPADLTSGISSVTTGIETPANINLRKHTDTSADDSQPQALFQVIGQTQAKVGQDEVFGSDHRYVLPSGSTGRNVAASSATSNYVPEVGGVQVYFLV